MWELVVGNAVALMLAAKVAERSERHRSAELRRRLEALGAELEGDEVVGCAPGFRFRMRYAPQQLPGGGRATHRTWLSCRVELGVTEMVFLLHPRTGALADVVTAGDLPDLKTGDAAFDEAYFAEVAPANLVDRALTVEVRDALLRLRPTELRIDERGDLVLAAAHWTSDDAREVVELGLALARGLAEAADQLLRAPVDGALAAYRGRESEGVDDALAREVEAAKALQRRRAQLVARGGQRAFAALGIFVVVLVLLGSLIPR